MVKITVHCIFIDTPFTRVNNPDYEKTINHIRISYQRCCEQRRNEFPETPFKSESTADGWRSRFTHFSELTIGAIKTLVTFVSTVRHLDELQPSTKLTITKDSLLALMIIKCSLEYIISEDRVRFMNGETYDQNSYIGNGSHE